MNTHTPKATSGRRFKSAGRNSNSSSNRSSSSSSSSGKNYKRSYRSRGKSQKKTNLLTAADANSFINKNPAEEEKVVHPIEHKFADFDIDPRIKRGLETRGYITPTPIQDQTIAHSLKGRDVVGLANTGTGKTAAFLIPLIDKILKSTLKDEQVMIMAPTRELAIQIDDELRKLTLGMKIFSAVIVGGVPIYRQLKKLKYFNHFIIGTPGRIEDMIEREKINMENMRTVVLDEADRMLDMGFIGDMRRIMYQTPVERHTLFFSATMSKDITEIIGEFLADPVTINVIESRTSKNIEQDIVRVNSKDKVHVLAELLKRDKLKRTIVFCSTKIGTDKLRQDLRSFGIRTEVLHGDKDHRERQQALKNFKDGRANVLLATDVAARGIDIDNVSHVINYDLPNTYDDYVHRIGRTGRGDLRGIALTFVEAGK